MDFGILGSAGCIQWSCGSKGIRELRSGSMRTIRNCFWCEFLIFRFLFRILFMLNCYHFVDVEISIWSDSLGIRGTKLWDDIIRMERKIPLVIYWPPRIFFYVEKSSTLKRFLHWRNWLCDILSICWASKRKTVWELKHVRLYHFLRTCRCRDVLIVWSITWIDTLSCRNSPSCLTMTTNTKLSVYAQVREAMTIKCCYHSS